MNPSGPRQASLPNDARSFEPRAHRPPSTREAVLAAIQLFANIHRFEGTGVNVRFAWRATNDLNNPGSFTLVGNNLTLLGEDVQDVDIATGAGNKLFFQLAISAISTTPGQVELTTWQQS